MVKLNQDDDMSGCQGGSIGGSGDNFFRIRLKVLFTPLQIIMTPLQTMIKTLYIMITSLQEMMATFHTLMAALHMTVYTSGFGGEYVDWYIGSIVYYQDNSFLSFLGGSSWWIIGMMHRFY
jgi:hypothetical protein